MPEPLSDERLNEIRKRLAAATCWPWARYGDLDFEVYSTVQHDGEMCDTHVTHGSDLSDDAELIAHAPQDLSDLLAEVDRRIPCARCSRPILPIDSRTPENEELDVCGQCALSVAREDLAEEIASLEARVKQAKAERDEWKAIDYADIAHAVKYRARALSAEAEVEKLRAEIADRDADAMNLRAERDALARELADLREAVRVTIRRELVQKVTTVEELEALPLRTVLLHPAGAAVTICDAASTRERRVFKFVNGATFDPDVILADGPLTVVWQPPASGGKS